MQLTHIRPLPLALLTLLALTSPVPASASLFSRTTDGVSRAHHAAVRRSAGLARDLRTAFKGILAPEPPAHAEHVRSEQVFLENNVHCVSSPKSTSPNPGLVGGGGGNGTVIGTATGTAVGQGATSTTSKKGSKTTAASSPTATASSNWKVFQQYSGQNFFSGWTFSTGSDPTHGVVNYLSGSDAASANLTSINSAGNAIMRVDTTPTVSSVRNSVRIQTTASYTQGLVILDAVHMPTGCATWPAFWSNGPNWPAGGEIDIVEGVNDYTNNQATIHTNPGCSLPSSSSSTLGITGTIVGGTDCSAADTGNQGCGVRSADTSSFGAAFNSIGGGVYAMLWTDNGIQVYFFHRSSIPSDITAGAPNPSGWGTPMANWPSTDCNTSQFFNNHGVIFDTTLCGDWAGSVWTATGIPGQDQSCAARTGVSTCEAFVQQQGAAFEQAYWEVKSVTIYQTS